MTNTNDSEYILSQKKASPRADCGSDNEFLNAKFRLKLKNVGKTIRLFRYQIRSVAQLCPTLCDPMNRSTPGLPVHHQLPEFTETHIHRVSDAIQPSHPLSSPSPPAPNPSQHQSFPMSQLFARGGQSTGVSASASFLPKKFQGYSPSEWTGWISLQSKGLSRVFSNTTVQKLPYDYTVEITNKFKGLDMLA